MPPRSRKPLTPSSGGFPHDDTVELTGQLLHFPDRMPQPVPSRRRLRRAEPARYRIKVTLDDSHPPIWRRLDVRSDLMLETFHQVLQAAFKWYDVHLHRFASGGSAFDPSAEHYLCEWDVEEGDVGIPEVDVRLDETLLEPGDKLQYCYDYGDDWSVTIDLEAVDSADGAEPPALCLAGERAAPPEDCGGLRTADDLAQVLDNPSAFGVDEVNVALSDPFTGVPTPEHAMAADLGDLMRRLHPDPSGEPFRQAVRRLIEVPPPASTPEDRARAVRPILWFLHHVGSNGVALTSAGYLRPVDVAACAAELPTMRDWKRPADREIQAFPVMDFREALQAVGLVRKIRGRLELTKAGMTVLDDASRVWTHLLGRLPCGNEKSMDRPAGWLYLVAAAAGNAGPDGAIADAMTSLGWRENGHRPISAIGVRHAVSRTISLLRNLSASSAGLFARQEVDPVVQDLCYRILRGGTSDR